jgi:hypothetical protein
MQRVFHVRVVANSLPQMIGRVRTRVRTALAIRRRLCRQRTVRILMRTLPRSALHENEALVDTVEHAALRLRIAIFNEIGFESHAAVVRQTALVNYADRGVDR